MLLLPSSHIRDMISFRYIGHNVQPSAGLLGLPGLPPLMFEAETPAMQMCPLCHLHDPQAPSFTLSVCGFNGELSCDKCDKL